MSALANANLSVGSLFTAVNTIASSADATFRTIGNVANVMAAKSQSWANVTRAEIETSEAERIIDARDNAALNIARRTVERERMLSNDPELKKAYESVLARFNGNSNSNS